MGFCSGNLAFLSPSTQPCNQSIACVKRQIQPSTNINWVPCFSNFSCARLEVPLDYENAIAGTTNIAVVKSSAPNASVETQDVFFNPGGPGDSPIGVILAQIRTIRSDVGDKHNVIGIDPRGVNNGGIDLGYFPNDQQDSDMFTTGFVTSVNSRSNDSLTKQWAVAGGWGDLCTSTHAHDSTMYASTSAVAQDKLQFIETLYGSSDRKLWYYGTSYGTVLGLTFATLYPDRVGRMLLDWVVDLEDYYSGQWKKNINDIDKTLADFFATCHSGGPANCAFYASSPTEIETQFVAIQDMLRKQPILVTESAVVRVPTNVTYELLESAVLGRHVLPVYAVDEARNCSA